VSSQRHIRSVFELVHAFVNMTGVIVKARVCIISAVFELNPLKTKSICFI
jgi:hypothetical protein